MFHVKHFSQIELKPWQNVSRETLAMNNKSKIGQIGEDLACQYLKNKKYKILDRNYRQPWGELDIITKAPDKTIVFVEVKTLKNNPLLMPEENLTSSKLTKLQRTAELYANKNPKLIDDHKGWQIDLVAITLLTESGKDYNIKHYENI